MWAWMVQDLVFVNLGVARGQILCLGVVMMGHITGTMTRLTRMAHWITEPKRTREPIRTETEAEA